MRIALLLVVALGIAAYTVNGVVLSQTDEPIPGCPEGVDCTVLHEWPPFTAVYEGYANQSYYYGGRDYTPRVTYQLEWRAQDDWTSTIVEAERFNLGGRNVFDVTGSWERQNGRTFTTYNAYTGITETSTLPAHDYMMPPGGLFQPITLSGFDLSTRTDGTEVSTDADICTGDSCHEVGTVGTTSHTGRKFTDDAIEGITFTNDAFRIPLKAESGTRLSEPLVEVLELQIHPTVPDEDACQTNLRTLIVGETLETQQWDDDCSSSNRSGASAHYYSFTLSEAQDITIRAASSADDLYLYLLDGTGKDGTVLAENDNLPSQGASGSSGPRESGITHRLEAGTYTIEVTTNALAHSEGSFGVAVDSPDAPVTTVAAPTPTPTATSTPLPPTPTPTATPIPPPVPSVTAEVVALDQWKFSWDNPTGVQPGYIALLERIDGEWHSNERFGSGNTINLPGTRPFVRAVHYRFSLRVHGDGRSYKGWSDAAEIELYEAVPPCRTGITTSPWEAEQYWADVVPLDWRVYGHYNTKSDALRVHDRHVSIEGCKSVTDRNEGKEFDRWFVYWFR